MKCSHCGHDIPVGKGICIYCGAVVRGIGQAKHDENAVSDNGTKGIADFRKAEDDINQEFTRLKSSRRRNPVSKAALACIFFLSMLVGGLVVWLFK